MNATLVFYTNKLYLVERFGWENIEAGLRCLESLSNDLLPNNINAIIAFVSGAHINRSRRRILWLHKESGYFSRPSRFGASLLALIKTHRRNEIMMGCFGY